MIHLYHGDGKGKTTCAIGLALRALGNGWDVCLCQFLKDGTSAEVGLVAAYERALVMHQSEAKFSFRMTDEDRARTLAQNDENMRHVLEFARSHAPALVVLDEGAAAPRLGLVSEGPVRELARMASGDTEGLELVVTGRGPDQWLIDEADYITEMRCERHPFERGIAARRGVEY